MHSRQAKEHRNILVGQIQRARLHRGIFKAALKGIDYSPYVVGEEMGSCPWKFLSQGHTAVPPWSRDLKPDCFALPSDDLLEDRKGFVSESPKPSASWPYGWHILGPQSMWSKKRVLNTQNKRRVKRINRPKMESLVLDP